MNSTTERRLQVWFNHRRLRPGDRAAALAAGVCLLMRNEKAELDRHVLAALRAPTLSGMPAVMNPKRISHHIGHFITGAGWEPSPRVVNAALHRLAAPGLVERANRWRTSWRVSSGSR